MKKALQCKPDSTNKPVMGSYTYFVHDSLLVYQTSKKDKMKLMTSSQVIE
jgi:hypothetical protein